MSDSKHLALAAALLLVSLPGVASADIDDWADESEPAESPENFSLELRVGGRFNDLGAAVDAVVGDMTLLLGAEIDYLPFRIPYVGLIGFGAGFEWSNWSAAPLQLDDAGNVTGRVSSQSTRFEMFTPYALAVLRIDVLARELGVPLIFAGKFGVDFPLYESDTSGSVHRSGWSFGLRYAGQLALELDFFDRRAAQRLDEEWGINHTALFAEIFGSTAGAFVDSQLSVQGWGWAAGLGFVF